MVLCSVCLKIFLFPLQVSQRSECPLAFSTERLFQNCSIRTSVQLFQLNEQNSKKFHRLLLFGFYLKIFLFPLQASQRPECPLVFSTERGFQNCSIKTEVQLCQLNAQNSKKFHRFHLCSFYLKIFLFPLQASQLPECPIAFSIERVLQKCSIKSKLQLCQMNAKNRK